VKMGPRSGDEKKKNTFGGGDRKGKKRGHLNFAGKAPGTRRGRKSFQKKKKKETRNKVEKKKPIPGKKS